MDITGVVVTYNTKELFEVAYTSFRDAHPDIPLIIVDGSEEGQPCKKYIDSLQDSKAQVISLGYNIGHGRGMCIGLYYTETKYALMFDSDIELFKSPVKEMKAMMEEDTFGVGLIETTDLGGYDFGARPHVAIGGCMQYLHPFFQLVNIKNYRKYPPYVHHGAPCYLTMLDIHNRGLSGKILKQFPGIHHTSGKGFSWEGKCSPYIRHDTAGTRKVRKAKGLHEIEGKWAYQ
jgi:hypothetical protein